MVERGYGCRAPQRAVTASAAADARVCAFAPAHYNVIIAPVTHEAA